MKFPLFQKKPCQRKCRNYLLLEALIAFSLIALCIFPLIQPHVSMMQFEKKYTQEMQLQRMAQNFFYDLKEMLYENKTVTWNHLLKGYTGQLPTNRLLFSKNSETPYECHFQILKSDQKADGNYLLLNVKLNLNPQGSSQKSKDYEYALLVKNNSLLEK